MAESDLFISYSRKDEKWLSMIQLHLDTILKSNGLTTGAWTDTQIDPGADFSRVIENAMGEAVAALLVVSADFFASDYIMNVEVPYLEKKHKETDGEFSIMWIPVRPCSFQGTAIEKYNALVTDPNKEVLSKLDESEVEETILKASEKIRDHLVKKKGAPTPILDAGKSVEILNEYNLPLAKKRRFVLESGAGLWGLTREQATLFPSRIRERNQAGVERYTMPRTVWKSHLGITWNGKLVLSDWNGSIVGFERNGRQSALYQAHHDDSPFHLLEASPESGSLLGASWSGRLRGWSRSGEECVFPEDALRGQLPTSLLCHSNGEVAVVLERKQLVCFDGGGKKMWSLSIENPIEEIWEVQSAEAQILVQVGPDRLLLVENGSVIGEQAFEAPIFDVSMPPSNARMYRAVVATRDGRLDWLAFQPFGTIRQDRVELDFSPVRVFNLEDPQRPGVLVAIGFTADGQLFSVADEEKNFYVLPEPIRTLYLCDEGITCFLVGEQSIYWVNNPALKPVECELGNPLKIDGILEVGAYGNVTLAISNTGKVPVAGFRASVVAGNGDDLVEENSHRFEDPLSPGETATWKMSVKAKQHGHLPLALAVVCMDSTGKESKERMLPFSNGIEVLKS